MDPFFLISDSDLSSSRLHISFSCEHKHTYETLGCGRAETKDRCSVTGPRDHVTVMKCKEDRERYWQTWSSGQSHALYTTSMWAHKSLTATPTHSRRQKTFGGQHWTHMGTEAASLSSVPNSEKSTSKTSWYPSYWRFDCGKNVCLSRNDKDSFFHHLHDVQKFIKWAFFSNRRKSILKSGETVKQIFRHKHKQPEKQADACAQHLHDV